MELSFHNRLYGHGHVLKQYARLPQWLPLPFTLQHGWLGGRRLQPTSSEFRSPLRTIWAWSEGSAAAFREHHDAVLIGGAPFLYLADGLRIGEAEPTRTGTIAFPLHGTRHISVEGDFDRYADELAALPGELHPIRICIHPEDMDAGTGQLFRRRGFEVVTNGPLASRGFLNRFISNVSDARYATSNQPTTALLYASYLGARVFLWGSEMRLRNLSSDEQPRGLLEMQTPVTEELVARLAFERLEDSASQRQLCDGELGVRYKLSPERLRSMILREYINPVNYSRLCFATIRKAGRLGRHPAEGRRGIGHG